MANLENAQHRPERRSRVSNHRDFGGIRAAKRRRVYPRRVDGTPRRFLTLVWIDVEQFELA